MNWQERHVLVTGGTGFIGSFMVEALTRLGATVRISSREGSKKKITNKNIELMVGDLTDPAFCKVLTTNCDFVFHLASHRKNVAYHHEHRDEVAEANVAMTKALIGALDPEVPVVFFSSANVPANGFNEAECKDGYILGKARAEALWKASGVPLLITRAVNVYGPRDYFAADGNVIPALIVRAAEAQEKITVWGSGKQERAFLYVEDIAPAVFQLINSDAGDVAYLYPSEQIAIKDLATQICDLVQPGLDIEFDTSKPEGALRHELPPLPVGLQEFPWTSLDEGLSKTVDWWQKHA